MLARTTLMVGGRGFWPRGRARSPAVLATLFGAALAPVALGQGIAIKGLGIEAYEVTSANERVDVTSRVEGRSVYLYVAVEETQSVAVHFKLCFSGTATHGTDYQLTLPDNKGRMQLDANLCTTRRIEANQASWQVSFQTLADKDDETAPESMIATLSADPDSPLPQNVGLLADHSSKQIEIIDNTPTPVTMTRIGPVGAILEDGGATTIEVTLGRTLLDQESVTAPMSVTGGAEGSHFDLAFSGTGVTFGTEPPHSTQSPVLDFGKGSRKATIKITARSNSDRDSRVVGLDWGANSRAPTSQGMAGGIALSDALDIPIANDDGLPSLNISPGAATAEGGSATFTIATTPNANPAEDAALNIGLIVSEQGGYVGSTHLGSKEIVLASGASSTTYSVPTRTDSTDEPNGSVHVTLQPVAAGERYRYLVGVEVASVTVEDAEATTVTLTAPAGNIAEGDSKTLTVTLSRALAANESLSAALSFGGVATFGTDYTLSAPSTLPTGVSYSNLATTDLANSPPTVTFTGGSATANSATIILAASSDANIETGQSVTVALGTLTPGTGLGGGATAAAGSVSFHVEDASTTKISVTGPSFVTEGTKARFTFKADPVLSESTTVHFTITGTDRYVSASARGEKQVTIPARKAEATWDVPTDADSLDEARGRVDATVNSGTRYTPKIGASSAKVEIRDDDPTTVTLDIVTDWALEGTVHGALIRLTPGRPLVGDERLTVPLALTETSGTSFSYRLSEGRALAGSFNTSTNTATFTDAGVLADPEAQVVEVGLRANYDGLGNAEDESLTASIPASSTSGTTRLGVTNLDGGASGAVPGDGVIHLLDAHIRNTISVGGGPAVTEGTAASFTVSLDGVARDDLLAKVRLEEQGNFAASSLSQRSIVFLAGDPNPKTIQVATENDRNDEAHGHIKATVVADPRKYKVAKAPHNEATVTVNDDDDPPPATPIATFSAATATTDETSGSTTASLALSLPAPQPLTLNYTLFGSATHGTDYSITGVTGTSGTVSVAKDGTSASIPVTITNDAAAEGDETIVITLADGSGYSVGTTGSTTITLRDDEPVVSVAGATSTVAEGAPANFTVSTRSATGAALTVELDVTQEGDFAAAGGLGARSVTIQSGASSATLAVATVNDGADEPDGTVKAALAAGSGYTISPAADAASVEVTDNDEPKASTTLSVTPNPVDEGQATVVTVTLDRALAAAVTVPIVTTAATAEPGDFGTLRSIRVPAGQRSATGSLSTSKDQDADDETLTVALGALPRELQAGSPGSVEVTIRDSMAPITVSLSLRPSSVVEGSTAVIVATLSRASSEPLVIPLRTILLTAEEGDCVAPDSLTIPAGDLVVSGAVLTTRDSDKDDESARLALGSLPRTVRPGSPASVTLTITESNGGGGGGGGGGPPPPAPPPPPPPAPPPSPGPPGRPGAGFDILGADCDRDLCTTFTGVRIAFQPSGGGSWHQWDFGDGGTSRATSPRHAWRAPGFYRVTLTSGSGEASSLSVKDILVRASEARGTCEPDASTLCLHDSRYAVRVNYETPGGVTGRARVVHAGTNDSGMFWFFNRENWEVLIKVLDGCKNNGHVWVFGASTTDLGYRIEVTDTATGDDWEEQNVPGTPAAAISDTKAFPNGCRSPG